ncbi:23S rRNA (adenine(2503)-C(2))-methyltransferase RlmN [Paludisphaera soli]|uniref:23S rRNA (adenine(2503)-C(2))-methyltransferase RlmN n=1 Tax=Paludisphaera soli TaxID=2712865 RepID=UPI0013EB9211|nr:radical SAM protein [Paludisphaera soli]
MDPRNVRPSELEVWAAERDCDATVVRKLLSAIFRRGVLEPGRWMAESQIPKRLALSVAPSPLPRLTLDGSVVSPKDGFQKLRFRTGEGLALETVLIPLHKEGAVSVCLSSQIGCAMGCTFCATARMAIRRNLQAWEIIDQFLQARELVQAQGRRVTGAVFMGMGEPFLNYDHVLTAADLLRSSSAGSVAAKAITISTVGLVPEIDRYTREGHRYRLAVSLGAATDAKRKELVPVASRWPVAEVVAAARRHALARRARVTLAYVCIGGVNVGEEDARALGELIGDTPVRVDLIEVTDTTGRYLPPTAEELQAFRDALTRHVGQPIVRRYSGGKDIQAACGTLAGVG